MPVKLYCAICGAECQGTIRNADGKLVCQPSELWARVGEDRYIQAMKDHRLLIPRTNPREPGEPVLPCGYPP